MCIMGNVEVAYFTIELCHSQPMHVQHANLVVFFRWKILVLCLDSRNNWRLWTSPNNKAVGFVKETFGSMEGTVAFWDIPIVLQILPYRIDIVNDLINAHFWINASYLINSPLYAVGIVLDTRLQVSQVPQVSLAWLTRHCVFLFNFKLKTNDGNTITPSEDSDIDFGIWKSDMDL